MHSVSSKPFTPPANLEQDTAGILNAADSDVQRKIENTADHNTAFDGGNFRSIGSRCVEITLNCLRYISGFFWFTTESIVNQTAPRTLDEVQDNSVEKKDATDEQNLVLSKGQKRRQRRNNTKQTQLSKPTDNQTAQAALVKVPDDSAEKEVATDQQHLSKTDPTVNQAAQATLVEVPDDSAEKKVATDQLSENVNTQEQLEYKEVSFRKPKTAKAPRKNTNNTGIDSATYAKLETEYDDIRETQVRGGVNVDLFELLERITRLQNEHPDFKEIRVLVTILDLHRMADGISPETIEKTADELYGRIKNGASEVAQVLRRVYSSLLKAYQKINNKEKLAQVYQDAKKITGENLYWESIITGKNINDTYIDPETRAELDKEYAAIRRVQLFDDSVVDFSKLLERTMRLQNEHPNFKKTRVLTTILELQLWVNYISRETKEQTADELYELIKACTYEVPEVLNRIFSALLTSYQSINNHEKLVEVYEYGKEFLSDKPHWELICGKKAEELNAIFKEAKQISVTDPIAAIYLYCDTLDFENYKLARSLDNLVSALRDASYSPDFNKVSKDVIEKLSLLRENSCANENFFRAGMIAVALSEIYYIHKDFKASCDILLNQKELETGMEDIFYLAENPKVDWTLAKRISTDGYQEVSDALLNAAIKKQFGREYAPTEATGNIKLDNIRLDGLKKKNCISEAVKLYHSMEKAIQFQYPFKLPYSSIEKVITILLSRGEERDQVLARKLAEELHKDSFIKRKLYYGVDISYAANKLSGKNNVDGLFIHTLANLGDTEKAIYLLKQCDFFNEKISGTCIIVDKPGMAVEILGKIKQLPISEPSINYRADKNLLHINKTCYNSSDFRIALLLDNLRAEYAYESKQNIRKTEIDWYYIHYLLNENKYTEALDLLIENLPYVGKEMRKKYIETQLYLCVLLKDWGELEKIWKKERTKLTDNKVALDDFYILGKLKQYIEVAGRIQFDIKKSDNYTRQKKLKSIQEETLRIIDEDMHITNGHSKAKVLMRKYQAYMLFGYSKAECDIYLEKCYQLSPTLSVGERKIYNAAFVNIEVKNIRRSFHGIKD